ncbi:MAG: hypothetical protein D6719_01665 [Candidatus Dadabacteria bacterium]|nr:MAG: hypothetical protein D6719_01665 [Candidatus Dadabacteria bacterium]
MAQLVATIGKAGYNRILKATETASAAYRQLGLTTLSQEVATLGALLCLLQILDGILTGIGVFHFGTTIEGNALLRALMENWGYVNALVFVKSLAILIILSLCSLSRMVSWLPKAMKAVIVIYLAAAIIPWTAVFIMKTI